VDERKWKQAWALLYGLKNQPEEVDETVGRRYNSVVSTFETLLSEDLIDFRIHDHEVAPVLVAALGTQLVYGAKCCDRSVMLGRVESLITYLQSLAEPVNEPARKIGF
jgi:hypothetical protein